MVSITVRCYAELNDFLLPDQRFCDFCISIPDNSTITTLISKIGIHNNLIDYVLVNGNSSGFSHTLNENDRVTLYPIFETFDISSITKVRDHALRQPKFILDVHLGKLVNHLRMLGFDTLYKNNYTNDVLISISVDEKRTLLTRSEPLLKSDIITHRYRVINEDPRLQLIEVLEHFDLYTLMDPFTRCIACNSLLKNVEKEIIISKIPLSIKEWCNEFQLCGSCDRIYWKGSHYQRMNAFIKNVLRDNNRIAVLKSDNLYLD